MIIKVEDIKKEFINMNFNDTNHTYSVNSVPLKESVTQIVHSLKREFNSDKISSILSNKTGYPKEKYLKKWEDEKINSCTLGTNTHSFCEKCFYEYAKNKSILLSPNNGYEEAALEFWKTIPEYIIPILSEIGMYHKKYMFAGTADLLLYDTNKKGFIIVDYKTNKDLYKNYNHQTLLNNFSFLLDNPINIYKLQLSLYQILLEQIPNVNIVDRKVVWLKPDANFDLIGVESYTTDLKYFLEKRYENRRSDTESSISL